MKRLLIIAAACSLSGCAGLSAMMAPPPATVANQTVLDERVASLAELAYQGAAEAILTRNSLKPYSEEQKEAVKAADRKAYEALVGVRAAYRAGNASSYQMAAAEAQSAVAALLQIIK